MKSVSEFACPVCKKNCTTKHNLMRHLGNKTPCVKPGSTTNIPPSHTCLTCNHTFSKLSNITKHARVSKCGKESAKTIENYKKLEEKNRKLEEKIEELTKMVKAGITPTVPQMTNCYNTTNNTQINVNMYGKETVTHITGKLLETIFNKCFKSVLTFIGEKHFSKMHPENANICITDIKSNHILYYDGDKWVIADRKTMLDTMYNKNCDELHDLFDDMREKLDDKIIEKFERFLDQKDDDIIQQKIKEDIKLMLYNERELALGNKKGM